MTTALIAASAALFVIFILSVPFGVDSHTALSAKRKFVVENVDLLGLISLAFSVGVEDGRIVFNGKRVKKETGRKKNPRAPLDPIALARDLNVVSFRVRGTFGSAASAASTALVSSSIIMIITLIKNTIFTNSPDFELNFLPFYDRNILEFDLKIRLKVNVFMIIFTGLKILRKRKRKWL